MSAPEDTIREALDALDEASHGWSDDNVYMRAHAAAVPALDALLAERDALREALTLYAEMGGETAHEVLERIAAGGDS